MRKLLRGAALTAACLTPAAGALAQTGVSDDRVSLPGGPGSLEGIGENVALDPNMGVMTYGVPIDVPQGFAGVTPQLRLAYSSGAGSSVVGVGWSLDVPHIERATLRGLPSYGRGDMFAANGSSELVEIPGAAAPTYRARFEGGFVRYTWLDAGDGREGYWHAEYPDGRTATFGATLDGTPVPAARVAGPDGTFRYMVVDTVDVYGHRMTHRYAKSGNASLVRQIEYVFGPDGAARYAVGFEYEERSDATGFDVLSDAKPGFDERLAERLAAVDVFSGPDRIRRYELAYEPYADSGGFTRLAEVAMRGAEGGIYPAVKRFTYSRTLEGVCEDGAGCERPFVIDMGNIGVNIGVGRATFVDINGDALPDLLDTTDDGAHRFMLNVPTADGRPRFADAATFSAVGQGSGFRLGTPFVQVLDVDGDGFADLLDARNGRALFNRAGGDWDGLEPLAETAAVGEALGLDFDQGEGELRTLRFVDLDNDKRIDLLRSTRETTSVWFNQGVDGFVEEEDIDLLGYDLQVDGIQMSDMNGDGLLDAVKLGLGGLRYKLNLGHGRWSEEVSILGLQLDESELDLATLDDINGDGLSDVVVVAGRAVKYAINRNGETFAAVATLDSGAVDGELPLRDGTVTVLMADINGNGSTDVVWLDAEGEVTALELFPIRPNQLARVENSLGQVTDIAYSTSVQMMARDETPWAHPLPHPMLVVEQIDRTDLLHGVHEITAYRYRDGFYDGIEKRFRGFAHVEIATLGDATQEDGLQIAEYDVGVDDPYRAGLMLGETSLSAGRPLGEIRNTFDDCPLAEVPATSPAIRFVCQTASETRVIEGAAAAEHVTLREESTFDGYGNVTLSANLGVVETGSGECAPCEREADVFGAACGAECRGDEYYVETEFVAPGAATDGRWILRAPFRVSTYGDPAGALRTESLVYYDGPDFEGLPLGSLTLGAISRTTEKLSAGADAVIETGRYRRDAHGNIVEVLDPLGAPGSLGHRRVYTIDETGLRITAVELGLEDAAGEAYGLRREIRYESLFDEVIEATDWMRVDAAGAVRSARRSTLYARDEFGRMAAVARPGDTLDAPTETYTYDLGTPSRLIARGRSEIGGPLDLETVTCLDGRGRAFQTRTRLGEGAYQVSGFSQYNVQGAPWRVFQPYVGASDACDLEPPADTRHVELFRDATGRALTSTLPDDGLYGEASTGRTVYGPLRVTTFDQEDNDPQSPHAATPATRHMDGLGRMVAFERTLADGQVSINRTTFDGLGRVASAADADGNRKGQSYDLLGRVVRIDDPNTGTTRLTYDAANNVIAREDARGVVLRALYDGQNRLIEQWDDADREGTLHRIVYDVDGDCDAALCSHGAARPVRAEFPGVGGLNVERYGYDLRGQRVRTQRVLEGVTFDFALTYDNAGRTTAVTWPGGRTLDYRYDAAARLVSIDGLVPAVEYDDRGQLSALTYADGSRLEQGYDAVMRLASRRIDGDGGALQALDYTRDRVGNILEITDGVTDFGPDLGGSFEYDAWYRTTAADLAPGAADGGERLTSTYDLIDNVVARDSSRPESPLAVGAYRYAGAGPNALTAAGDLNLSYDEAGHALERGGQTFEWDARGRLSAVFGRNDAPLARYAYGLAHQRAVKVVGDSTTLYASPSFELRDGLSTLYVTLGANRLARIEDAALATTALTDLAPQGDLDGRIDAADAWVALAAEEGLSEAPVDAPSSAGALLESAVRRMFVDRGPEVTFLHHDHLGSLVMATDGDTGEVLGKRAFYPTGAEQPGGFGHVDTYGFSGQEHDATTGLINFEHRLLDPLTGRWMSPDPSFAVTRSGDLANPAEALNVYGYVGNNYANVVDPDGLEGEGAKKGNGASGDGKGNAGTKGGAKQKGALGKAAAKVCATCKAVGKAINWKMRRAMNDTTAFSTPELKAKIAKDKSRAAALRHPATIKRVRQALKAGKLVKGAVEVAMGGAELAAGDPMGGVSIIEGGMEVAEAFQDLRALAKLDPKNPDDAAKLLADIPGFLEKAAKHYDAKVAKFDLAIQGRVQQQLLDTGMPVPTELTQNANEGPN